MNLVVLKGNLVRDPEVKTVTTGGDRTTKVANLTIATTRFFKRANGEKDKDTTFIACEAWDTGADSMEKILHKGDPVLIKGSLKVESWEKDGVNHSRTKVRVSNFEKLYRSSFQSADVTQDPDTSVTQPAVAEPAETPVGDDIPF